jgi:cytidyltransferase-like protein
MTIVTTRPIRVYTDMCADLCHYGHFKFLSTLHETAQSLYPDQSIHLVVGIHSDETIATYKRIPIQTMEERMQMVAFHPNVEEVVPSAPLTVTNEYLASHDIDHIGIGGGKRDEVLDTMYGLISVTKSYIAYTGTVSTTDLIRRCYENFNNVAM